MKKLWKGPLGLLMQKHLDLRKSVGRVSKANAYNLYHLNLFLNRQYPNLKTLNRIAILDFLREKENLSIAGRRNYIIHIRQFCLYLNQRGIRCYVPDKTLMPKYRYRPRYTPLSEKDLNFFMQAARQIRANRMFIGETYAVMLGLLWCTGMRRREIVRLTHADVDLKQGVLFIRETKFQKDRIIPLSPSVTKALKKYEELKITEGYSIAEKSSFFVNLLGKAVPGHSLSTVFNRIVVRMKITDKNGKRPSLHNLRHNFATQTMARFMKDPETFPVSASMARLSTYLGHASIMHTQYYLHPDFNLMQGALENFGFPK